MPDLSDHDREEQGATKDTTVRTKLRTRATLPRRLSPFPLTIEPWNYGIMGDRPQNGQKDALEKRPELARGNSEQDPAEGHKQDVNFMPAESRLLVAFLRTSARIGDRGARGIFCPHGGWADG